MKRKRQITIYILICLCILSCMNCTVKKEVSADEEYKNDLATFPMYLIDFFPDSLSDVYLTIKNVDITNECIYFMNFDLEFSEEKELYLHNILANAQRRYNSSDSCLLVISRKEQSISKKYHTKCNDSIVSNYCPIPFFEARNISYLGINCDDIYSNKNICGLSEGFDIYVLESKPGLYWSGLGPSRKMPEYWKNGYSKGICVNSNKNTAIYWTIIW